MNNSSKPYYCLRVDFNSQKKMQHPYFCNNARHHWNSELQGGIASFSVDEEEDVFEK